MARIKNEVREAVIGKITPITKTVKASPAKESKVEEIKNKRK